MSFLEKDIFGNIVVDFQSFKTSLKTPKTDFVWPSKRAEQVAV